MLWLKSKEFLKLAVHIRIFGEETKRTFETKSRLQQVKKEHNQAHPSRARRLKGCNKKATGQLATAEHAKRNSGKRLGALSKDLTRQPSPTTHMLHIQPPYPDRPLPAPLVPAGHEHPGGPNNKALGQVILSKGL